MTSSFTSQLATLAANSSHELDLRARKAAHSSSLLFPQDVAARQDWNTIYTICLEGFRELCSLDAGFVQFERNLFSAQSREMDREGMNKSENEALDGVLGRCLRVLSGRLVLSPGVRCLEWLVRRFQVHVHNTRELMLAVLPLHSSTTLAVWRNVLSIVPAKNLVGEWKFVLPYHKEAGNIPRHTVVYAATNNDAFFAALNAHVLTSCREGSGSTTLLRFWNGVVSEAVAGRLGAARSGIREVQRQRVEGVLLKVLPVLSDGFEIKTYPELTTGCFTLTMILAAKADLEDRVLDSLLQAVAGAADVQGVDFQTVIVALLVIVQQKQDRSLPKAAVDLFASTTGLTDMLKLLGASYPVTVIVEALMNGSLASIKRRNLTSRLRFVETLLRFLGVEGFTTAFDAGIRSVLSHIQKLDPADSNQSSARTKLIEMLRDANEDSILAPLIAATTSQTSTDREEFEALIGSTVALIEAPPQQEEDAMEIDSVEPRQELLQRQLAELPSQTDEKSFLASHNGDLFQRLLQCFMICCRTSSGLTSFSALPLWSSAFSLYLTFLIRVGLGDNTARVKASALTLLSRGIIDTKFDLQALLPYTLSALCDPAASVRQAAGEVLVAIDSIAKSNTSSNSSERFGGQRLYSAESDAQIAWISPNHFAEIMSQVCLPSLEECVLDPLRVNSVVQSALNGLSQTPSGTKTGSVDLKKSTRHSFFELLTTHAVATPLLRLKVEITRMLETVNKVGTATKHKALMPLLDKWIEMNEMDAQNLAQAEGLQVAAIDSTMVQLISPHDKDSIGQILSTFERPDSNLRANLVASSFQRMQNVWGELKHDVQLSTALRIFELSFATDRAIQGGSQNFLQNAELSTNVIGGLLEQSTGGLAQMQTEDQQPRKRRRTSHGRDSLPNHMVPAMEVATSRLTLALELVDSSGPENRPELMSLLFTLLGILKRLRGQQRLESPYLLNLCLSSILLIVDRQKSLSKPTIDMSSVRADLVTDCVRSLENPQVQNTALLLSASLSTIAPDPMLHNLMPIFAFMGQNMFSKEDEHSVHVINQAIDQIVPALVTSLKKRKQDVLKSTSGLLSSFAAAFDHIPQQQRVALYQRLLHRMGVSDYAFVLIVMLVLRNKDSSVVTSFINALVDGFSAPEQLETYEKLVNMAVDATQKDSKYAEDVLEFNKKTTSEELYQCSDVIFSIALRILGSKSLKTQTGRMHKMEENNASALRAILTRSISQLLQAIKILKAAGHESQLAKQCMDALLDLPSLAELLNLTDAISSELDLEPDLNAQILRVIASKLDGKAPKEAKTRIAALDMLSRLIKSIVQPELDMQVKQAVIVCIDKISEAYGRKDLDRVLQAAQVLCGNSCLAASESAGSRRIKLMSLLCLASLAEILKETCASIVPELTLRVVSMLQVNIQQGDDEEIHNAIYALIASMVTHVPYLISDDSLSEILVLSSRSAAAYTSATATESRVEALSIIGSKLDISSLVSSLAADELEVSMEYIQSAELEKLDLLSTAIDAATKADVVKNADLISQIILAHLDQRTKLAVNEDDLVPASIDTLESKINQVSIKLIYKLNDTVFRPIFESWVDWAVKCHDLSSTPAQTDINTKIHRQTSLFNLLTHFFTTLKSIVTSYASYIIQPACAILIDITTTISSPSTNKSFTLSPSHLHLYKSLLTLLQSTFTHDADTFFASPSRFQPLSGPLTAQLELAAYKPLRPLLTTHIIPTILSLALATIDTPTHHQTLSHNLTSLRHNPSPHVRLASIQTLVALTLSDALGDDWLANTVGVGSASHDNTQGDGVGIARGGGSSAGEVMIYVNEMLEDEDEGVEMEVRRWVQLVREKVGEDVFEV